VNVVSAFVADAESAPVQGVAPAADGWSVVNLREAEWWTSGNVQLGLAVR
jgi:hypothetical protein